MPIVKFSRTPLRYKALIIRQNLGIRLVRGAKLLDQVECGGPRSLWLLISECVENTVYH